MVRTTAIIPVKRFGEAKKRLLERLDRPQRAAIVKAMLADVLSAVTTADAVERVILVSGEGRAERVALRHAQRVKTPIEVFVDPDDPGPPPDAVRVHVCPTLMEGPGGRRRLAESVLELASELSEA